MLPQPPPNAPAPPPSEAAILSQKKWKWLWVVGVGSIIIIVLAVLTAPLTLRSRKKADQTEAVSNARQIGLALSEFQNEYWAYPNAGTIAAVQKATGTTLNLGTKTSNDFFRQLIGGDFTQSENMFYAPKIPGVRKPNDNITGVEALKKGECGFAYFLGARLTDNPRRPLAAAPMIPGTDQFDPKAYEGKAVVLRMDNSVTSFNIDKDGHIQIEGKLFMDPTNPIWDGHPPLIVWPEL
jgi:type II secretory pathway pseudopilin PulG